ncbi:MAG: ATP-binding protein [Nocardioidaceae bacterium]
MGREADDSLAETLTLQRFTESGLVERLPAAVYVAAVGATGRWYYVSERISELLGFTPQEFLDDPTLWARQLHPQDRDAVLLQESSLLSDGRLKSEYRMLRRDGGVVWLLDDAVLRDADDGQQLLHGLLYDVSDRKRAEMLLAAHAEVLERVGGAEPLSDVLAVLARAVDEISGRSRCTVEVQPRQTDGVPLLVDGNGCLDDLDDLAGLRPAAIEVPVKGRSGEVVGRLAIRYPDGVPPQPEDEDLAVRAARLAVIAVGRADEQRRTSESFALLEATLESTVDGILVVDTSGRIAGHNQKFVEMWRIDPHLLTSGDDARVMASVLEQLVDPDGFVAQVRALYDERHRTSFDELAFLDGRVFERYSQPQRLDGRTVGRVWSFRDVTDKRRLQQDLHVSQESLQRLVRQLESVLNSAGEGIYGLDAAGRLTFLNDAGARLLGVDRDAVVGRHVDEVIVAERDDAPDAASRVTTGRHRRADGSVFESELISAPMVEAGEVIGSVVVFRDISERRAIDRMKDEFISVVSHELRTPLTSIRGALGLLSGGAVGELPPKAGRMVDVATMSADRLIRLINDILDVERMAAGKLTLHAQPNEARSLVETAVEEASGLAAEAGVRLVVTSAAGTVRADRDRVVQVLTNLLGNAVKFSPAGSSVEVGTTELAAEVRFDVHDRGHGIPADQLEEIFERFRQADASDTRTKGGTGLGLTICRGLVQRHGGRIWAERRPGGGATLSFTLPRLKDATALEGQGS